MLMHWIICVYLLLVRFVGNSNTFIIRDLIFSSFSNCTSLRETLGVSYDDLFSNKYLKPDPQFMYIYQYRNETYPLKYPLTSAAGDLIRSTYFNKDYPIVLYIPGFFESSLSGSVLKITSAFRQKGTYNVLYLNAERYTGSLRYFYISSAVRFVGEFLGDFILELIMRERIPKENLHLIGFSFGAHIAGFAGKRFKELTRQTLSRITGLDPAGMCFVNNPPSLRLDKSDADFVDVVHSNAGNWGMNRNLGHIDFYPNGGFKQPLNVINALSHQYSWIYYSKSVLFPKSFEAAECDSWISFINGKCYHNQRVFMGYGVKSTDRGVYYLMANVFPAYGYGKKSVPKDFNEYLSRL